MFIPEALRHLAAQVVRARSCLAATTLYPWEQHPVDAIFATTSLSNDEKAAILGGNAARVFDMKT